MEKDLLSVQNLSVRIASKNGPDEVIRQVSFNISKGQVVGLVGESGSGKSLTSLALMQLLPSGLSISGGSIFFHGKPNNPTDLCKTSEREMQQLRGKEISMIFQEPMTSLNPSITCGDQVLEAIRRHLKMSRRESTGLALEWLERVKIPQPLRAFNAYPHQLSGGQRQRVMIAMALCCNPSLLIADEPTTALDVTVQRAILELMLDLQRELGMSILFITHDLGVVNEIADEVLVMYQGKVVEQGKVKEVLTNPQHEYTKGLLGCRPPVDKKLSRLPVMSDFLQSEKLPETIISERIIPKAEQEARKKEIYVRPPVLQVKNLRVRFVTGFNFLGKPRSFHYAVSDVSFNLFSGETLGLVGESGCGKTTLGRSILQLVRRNSGEIIYKGIPLNDGNWSEQKSFRKTIQLIFQDPYSSLNPKMTIGSILTEPMLVHKTIGSRRDREEKAMTLLQQVGLDASAYHKYPHQFSGGQRQRIGIARALALEPEIIICDESVSALDMSVQAQVLNLLNDLKQTYGLTYLFISHDLSVVKYMSDRIIVMKDGKIEEEGDADQVYDHPESPYTRKLIESIPKAL